jgi:hypothetical protein
VDDAHNKMSSVTRMDTKCNKTLDYVDVRNKFTAKRSECPNIETYENECIMENGVFWDVTQPTHNMKKYKVLVACYGQCCS